MKKWSDTLPDNGIPPFNSVEWFSSINLGQKKDKIHFTLEFTVGWWILGQWVSKEVQWFIIAISISESRVSFRRSSMIHRDIVVNPPTLVTSIITIISINIVNTIITSVNTITNIMMMRTEPGCWERRRDWLKVETSPSPFWSQPARKIYQ